MPIGIHYRPQLLGATPSSFHHRLAAESMDSGLFLKPLVGILKEKGAQNGIIKIDINKSAFHGSNLC